MKRVAIMGGTFNPVHLGHLIMADQALHQFHLDQVLWIPAGEPPHKPAVLSVSPQDRLEMLKLAIQDHPKFAWSDLEIKRQGRSYTVQTLDYLVKEYPEREWYWIIGGDALQDLLTWHQVERVVKLCTWIVAPRSGSKAIASIIAEINQKLAIQAVILETPFIEISSTFIRQQIQHQGSIRYLVPPSVEKYIYTHGLYASRGEGKI
jgi:nicotinate-nucleotide adenylyltransferase